MISLFLTSMTLSNRIAIIVIALLASIAVGHGQEINELDQLFNQLGSNRYEIRQKAHDQILEEGKKNKDSILDRSLDIYLKSTDPEIRYRLRSAMFGSTISHILCNNSKISLVLSKEVFSHTLLRTSTL